MTRSGAEAQRYVDEYLEHHHVMMLATSGDEGSLWVCSLYYVYAARRLLFLSRPDSRHALEIGAGSSVAFAVTETDQKPPASAHGVQGTGLARPAKPAEMPWFLEHYGARFPSYVAQLRPPPEALAAEQATGTEASRAYVVLPDLAKLVDKRYSAEPVVISLPAD
jgi:uncharacterized protein YhbP (UPF0306 family)